MENEFFAVELMELAKEPPISKVEFRKNLILLCIFKQRTSGKKIQLSSGSFYSIRRIPIAVDVGKIEIGLNKSCFSF